ncbi:hypothetical protein M9Y10_026610 [Tritrichomonas musculus]|uniref:Uncharacterized protein n=1 Tax=Tritrichomonas musculus TaxID=1915356 RepID=A0ABR2H8F9_9EUKA
MSQNWNPKDALFESSTISINTVNDFLYAFYDVSHCIQCTLRLFPQPHRSHLDNHYLVAFPQLLPHHSRIEGLKFDRINFYFLGQIAVN